MLSGGNLRTPGRELGGRAVIPLLCHALTCPCALRMYVSQAFVFQAFSCLAACDVLNTTLYKGGGSN